MNSFRNAFYLLAGLAALIPVAGLSGCERQEQARPASTVSKKPVARDMFKQQVMGKNDRQVEEKLGKPDSINNYAGSWGILWVYTHRTINPETGKPDQFATLVFKEGVVNDVSFK